MEIMHVLKILFRNAIPSSVTEINEKEYSDPKYVVISIYASIAKLHKHGVISHACQNRKNEAMKQCPQEGDCNKKKRNFPSFSFS